MTETTRQLPPYQPPLTGLEPQNPWYPPTAPPADPPKPRRGVGLLVAVALAAGLVGGGTGAVLTARLDDSSTPVASSLAPTTGKAANSPAPQGSVEQVAAEVLPSVVSIAVQTPQGGGEGTGVILDSDGLILTNNHVVEGATSGGGSLTVTLNDGSTASASIVGTDPTTDLAVIKADGVHGLTPAKLGDSSTLAPGEAVVAIGSPLGLQGTVTSGIVSALDRPVRTGSAEPTGEPTSTVIDAIQTDAAINPGNSGGPLVNMSGEVVGINSAIATLGSSAGGQSGSIGLGFSIPIDQAKGIAQQLIDTGHAVHAQLGVGVTDASASNDAAGGGATLAEITPGGAAAKAGLQQGDVVTKVGDRQVDSADALIAAIRSHRPGDTVTLTVVRGGSSTTVEVSLGSDATQS